MAELRVLFIGAGAVNFGGAEGPWDHSRRLETLPGVRIVAIADIDTKKARDVLASKRTGAYAEVYKECEVYPGFAEAIKKKSPQVAFIGVPPIRHGDLTPPKDIELQCLKAGLHIFVEKPLSVTAPEEFLPYAQAVETTAKERGLVVSVGYMFRYHAAVEKMKELLEQYGRKIMCINARYNCAYAASTHPFWWDKRRSGGPIVEQATHFCDLLRYFGGEVNLDTLSALAIAPSDDPTSAGFLSNIDPVTKESELPQEARVPRLTSANWRFADGGGVGSLTHGVVLQGGRYEAAIDVWGDGLRLALEEPYVAECRLRVRIGDTDDEEVFTFPEADPYMEEDLAFIKAVRSGDHTHIRSGYHDAAKTYLLSWAIRRASEKQMM